MDAQYIRDHIEGEPVDAAPIAGDAEWGQRLYDLVLEVAARQLGDSSAEEVTVAVPFTVKPFMGTDRAVAMGGCIEICVDLKVVSMCYHRGFKGKKPGPG